MTPRSKKSDLTRDKEYFDACNQVKTLVRDGILHPDYVRLAVAPEPKDHLITFGNTLEGRQAAATITHENLRLDDKHDKFKLRVYFDSDAAEDESEVISVTTGNDLAALITRGKNMLHVHRNVDSKKENKAKTTLLQVRIEPELKTAFENAVAAEDDSQARVIRKLIKYYLGQGPDPKVGK